MVLSSTQQRPRRTWRWCEASEQEQKEIHHVSKPCRGNGEASARWFACCHIARGDQAVVGFHRSGVAGPLLVALNVGHLQTTKSWGRVWPDLQHQWKARQSWRWLPWAAEWRSPLCWRGRTSAHWSRSAGGDLETFFGKLGSWSNGTQADLSSLIKILSVSLELWKRRFGWSQIDLLEVQESGFRGCGMRRKPQARCYTGNAVPVRRGAWFKSSTEVHWNPALGHLTFQTTQKAKKGLY